MPPASASSGSRNLRTNDRGAARRSRRMYRHPSPSSSSRFRFPLPPFITSTRSSSSSVTWMSDLERPGTSSRKVYSPGVSTMSTGAPPPPPIPWTRACPCPWSPWCA
uniref:Uncharacterized protein n=1 Tax=Arundo donax TaxID=35708 RepID=A0A0A9DMS7_ARUDO